MRLTSTASPSGVRRARSKPLRDRPAPLTPPVPMRLLLPLALPLILLSACRLEPRPAPEAPAPPAAPTHPVSDADVTVYVTEWCPYCQATREYLDEIGVEYTAVDIESGTEAYSAYQAEGGTGSIPLVVIGDTRIQGYSVPAIDEALDRAGL